MSKKHLPRFLELNRHKLPFALAWTSVFFLAFSGTILAILYLMDMLPEMPWSATILVLSGLCLPVLVVWLAYLDWRSKRIARNRAYSTAPFDQLPALGFNTILVHEHNKWQLTEEILQGTMDGCELYCDISQDNYRTLVISAPFSSKELARMERRELVRQLLPYHVDLSSKALAKQYNTKQPSVQTFPELKADLEQFVVLLKRQESGHKK